MAETNIKFRFQSIGVVKLHVISGHSKEDWLDLAVSEITFI